MKCSAQVYKEAHVSVDTFRKPTAIRIYAVLRDLHNKISRVGVGQT